MLNVLIYDTYRYNYIFYAIYSYAFSEMISKHYYLCNWFLSYVVTRSL